MCKYIFAPVADACVNPTKEIRSKRPRASFITPRTHGGGGSAVGHSPDKEGSWGFASDNVGFAHKPAHTHT